MFIISLNFLFRCKEDTVKIANNQKSDFIPYLWYLNHKYF